MRSLHRVVAALAALLAIALPAVGQGIETRAGAVVLHGSGSNTSAPAAIVYKTVARATVEAQTIRSEGVVRGSARFELLTARMHKRIASACRKVARANGHDCVVKKRDIKNDNGLSVTDITDDVVAELESADDGE